MEKTKKKNDFFGFFVSKNSITVAVVFVDQVHVVRFSFLLVIISSNMIFSFE